MKQITLTAAIAGTLAIVAPPALADNTNVLSIYHAIEIVYQTEPGKAYTLQGAVGLTNWTDVGDPVLGNGQIEDHIYSTKDSSIPFTAYRLQISPGPTNGFAPWAIEGIHLQMDDDTASNVVQYLSRTNGQDVYVAGNDPFDYSYSRLSENDGRVDRTYSPDRRDSLLYSYNSDGTGTWTRDEFEHGILKSHKIGSFHYTAYNNAGTNPPPTIVPASPPAPPTTLTGLVYYVFSGSLPDKYEFNNATTGTATPAAPGSGRHAGDVSPGGNAFTYAYTVLSSNTASLNINFGYYGIGGDRQEYDLTFEDGPSGQFNRRIYRLGSLFTTDHGVFTPNSTIPSATPSSTNNPANNPTSPPTNPVGYTYTMNLGQVPSRLVFQTVSTGIEFDDSAPSDFTYAYSATGANTFSLRVQFKPDRWDDYDLTFTAPAAGTIVRREYRNNDLNRTESGTFSVSVNH